MTWLDKKNLYYASMIPYIYGCSQALSDAILLIGITCLLNIVKPNLY